MENNTERKAKKLMGKLQEFAILHSAREGVYEGVTRFTDTKIHKINKSTYASAILCAYVTKLI